MAIFESKISPKEFVIVRDIIKERTGIYIRDSRSDYLEYRLRDRMMATGIQNFEEYYYYLKYNPGTSGEFQNLINLITVQETSFFRNPDQLKSFQNTVLKEIVDKKNKAGQKGLRLWSAASSTGEEAVTLAIILNETLPYLFNWDVEIIATDISTRALDLAKKGLYDEQKLKDVPQNITEKYFTKDNRGFVVKDTLSRLIKLNHLNLTTDFSKNAEINRQKFDVIFCRNVFIYFPDEVKEKITEGFYNALNPGGYIFLGNAETIDVRKVPFRMTFLPGGMVYQKP